MTSCSVCGGDDFVSQKILEPKLIGEWQLSGEETAYIDAQQGTRCMQCGASLRVGALADALLAALGRKGTLTEFCRSGDGVDLRVLDINGAVSISDVLATLPGYVRADHPDVDMLDLPYPDASFDIVLHSDTLEHVPNPMRALEECRRVLAPGGHLCYTAPTIVGRLTRSRAGLPKSYHGNPKVDADDYLVHTEFGADMWCFPLRAGFAHVTINHRDFPAAIAITATQAGGSVEDPAAARHLRGYVDAVGPDLVAGWAMEQTAVSAVAIDVIVNETTTIRTPAQDHRPDLQDIYKTSGNHGFQVPLDRSLLRPGHNRVTVCFAGTGVPLPNGDRHFELSGSIYDQDGLRTVHNHEFMSDPGFVAAYRRGIAAAGADYNWHWRVHVGLWAATVAANLPGDFIECGVNRGFMSSAIMEHLDWDNTGRMFYLLDTFSGINPDFLSPEEVASRVLERNAQEIGSGFYTTDAEVVHRNFSTWENKKIIVGAIPTTLVDISTQEIAFLHVDLNCSLPEVATLEALWDRIVTGGVILLDDYAYHGFRSQKVGIDGFAREKRCAVLSLPTGQGLIVKP
jgi:SAM-dependent methyltransferase